MHNAQPESLLRRPELFTWAETLFSQCWGGANLQFIKQRGTGNGVEGVTQTGLDDTRDGDAWLLVIVTGCCLISTSS